MVKIILFIGVLSVPVMVVAELPRFYVGVKGGYQWAQDDNYSHSPGGAMVGVYSGLQFTPSWSWDAGYQYHDELKAEAISVNVKTWLIESAVRYDWYLQDNLSFYGRLGVGYWNMEKTQFSSDKSDATGFSPLGEVGVNYNFDSNIRLSAGYQYIDGLGKAGTGKYDSYGLLVGLTYLFGGKAQPELVEIASTPIIENILEEEFVLEDEFSVAAPSAPQVYTFESKVVSGLMDVDSTELGHNFIEELTDIALLLKTNPQAQAFVVGYTDSIGSPFYNQVLSERRAKSVVNKLIELEVTPAQLEWRGEGESQPIADNKTVDGRAQNRRVEITISNFQM
ncbi:OmpA family protein [Vibrio mediterranei]|uniref:OmpA-like domain-containing protein n=1 Tax=Vibrio mediterranei TaxID=689 RepID=A0AAN1FLV3_9VIBR|nr:outer membrane beta-barrel protein [Vibrio mediterranei]ASI93054.1 hypothetical protein BSZ05_25215 [Vibrio mediterranei]